MVDREVRMLLSFQRPSHLLEKGDPSHGRSRELRRGSRGGPMSIAPDGDTFQSGHERPLPAPRVLPSSRRKARLHDPRRPVYIARRGMRGGVAKRRAMLGRQERPNVARRRRERPRYHVWPVTKRLPNPDTFPSRRSPPSPPRTHARTRHSPAPKHPRTKARPRPTPSPTTAPAPSPSAVADDRRNRSARSAARSRGRGGLRRSGSSPTARSPPPGGGRARWCRG